MNIPLSSNAYPDLPIALKSVNIFSTLDEACLQELIPELETLSLLSGEVLLRQGEQSDRLYILLAGRLDILPLGDQAGDQPLRTILPGQSIGEISLITGEVHASTILAREDSSLVTLTRAGLSRIAARSPELEAQIISNINHSFRTAQLTRLLEESETFGSLAQPVLRDLQGEFTFESLKGGEALMRHGDPSQNLYLIISGRLGVFMPDASGENKRLIDLGRGQTVGENGLITHEARSADVVAIRDTLLARLSAESFEHLLNKYPKDILEHFAGASIKRLTGQIQGKSSLKKTAVSIAILPVHPDIPVQHFAAHLAQALESIGSTILINSRYCDEQLSWAGIAQTTGEDPLNTRLVLWLSEQEAGHRYVVYECDPAPSPWNERCLRQVDQILLLSPSAGHPAEPLALPNFARTATSLVLLYEEDVSHPVGTQAALDRYALREQYKVRLNKISDYARLARLLTGNGIGLVLSGGGARAGAQIGVLRALLEAGYEIDAVCGVSAGAANAALLAMDLTPQEILGKWLASARPVDFTFPYHSLVSGKNWTRGLREMIGEWRIEDFWLDCFCISANLTRSILEVHRSGSAFHAVRASSSGPGILPPVYQDSDVLVDGGLINNFPANILRADPRIGTIIGIDVSEVRERFSTPPFGYSVSGWHSLLARFLPFMEKPIMPNILEILSEALLISKSQSETSNRSLVDLYLCPPTQQYNLIDFNKIVAIEEAGYQYGRKVLAERQAQGG